MARYINDYQIEINYNIEINGLERRENFYIIKAGTYPVAEAYVVIIATGVFDRPKKPPYPIPEEIKIEAAHPFLAIANQPPMPKHPHQL